MIYLFSNTRFFQAKTLLLRFEPMRSQLQYSRNDSGFLSASKENASRQKWTRLRQCAQLTERLDEHQA